MKGVMDVAAQGELEVDRSNAGQVERLSGDSG
jgi:hypothetical protein